MLIQGLFCLDYLKSNLLAELHLHNLQNSEHNFDGFVFVCCFFYILSNMALDYGD